ncbi:MAG: bifunctional (p)ppGpp synthetase/guanosine-3',5'-bis(diphosphate) 3'-pyrophosphohydrolase [Bryobacteraceae bacterium]|jgi:GTP pyrophosphokinase|nr:bifunctional (p)ppGpp synthetase/guanosine-3',5'-bis(diphosphate) 3'-pyrophosphohydrolase [Bryobacteraceae bacterium]
MEPDQTSPASTLAVESAQTQTGSALPGVTPEILKAYQTLEDTVRQRRPNDDLASLRRAFEFACECHADQRRDNGEPYVTHPIAAAQILADMQMDLVTVETALLHDTLEDTKATLEEIKRLFGEDVARCVNGVTKLSKLKLLNKEVREAESVRKMLLAMIEDIRVILVKLADRLHNLRTLDVLPRERQERIAAETVELYAPIAHRLGMGKLRAELEDLGFRYYDPEAYAEVVEAIESKRRINDQFLHEIRDTIERKLSHEGIPARVQARVKRPWSVYLKLRKQKIGIEHVYDLLGIRIITDSVKNCYAALGVIHNEWPPIPGRIKDFIAIPRPNLYQSLHTSVLGAGGVAFEVQIRTEEMHRLAEEGIAAHWKYKEGKKGPAEDDQRIAWLRQLVEWQREMRDSTDFMANLKVDLYPEEVYCFTPKGRVVVLPREATPIDFAYSIHTDVGHQCTGAKVNGRMVPLKHALRNGDIVEILTSTGSRPSRDWLTFVKTARARNKIRGVINADEREKAIELGQKLIEREARRLGVALSRVTRAQMESVAGDYGCSKIEDLYAALGWGKYSARQVLTKLAPEVFPEEPPPAAAQPAEKEDAQQGRAAKDAVVLVKGVDDLLTYRAKCCNPIRGEPIVGYITRGKGVAVHSKRCPNVVNLLYEAERRIEVEWARAAGESFHVRLVVHTDNRTGMLNQLTQILFDENINIRSVEAHADERSLDTAVVEMTIDVRDKKQMEKVVGAMRRVSGVRDIERVY